MISALKFDLSIVFTLRVISEFLAGQVIITIVTQVKQQEVFKDDDSTQDAPLNRLVVTDHVMQRCHKLGLPIRWIDEPLTRAGKLTPVRITNLVFILYARLNGNVFEKRLCRFNFGLHVLVTEKDA